MIKVTRLNGSSYHLNALYILMVESNPDTMISMRDGHKYIVRESVQEIVDAIHKYHKSVGLLATVEKENTHEE